MIMRIGAAFSVECVKAIHMKLFWLAPAIVILAQVAGLLVHPLTHDGMSGYSFIAAILPPSLDFLGFILLLMFCAGLVSGDIASGMIRQTLLQPLRRYEYVLAKVLLGMAYALFLTLAAVGFAWILPVFFGELNGVEYGGDLLFSREEMLSAYILGALLSLAPLWASCAFAIMISTFTRSSRLAGAVALSSWILADMIKHPLHIAPYVFTTYLEQSWQVFIDRSSGSNSEWWPMSEYLLFTSAVPFVVCSCIAIISVQRRDFAG